jgi:excisionase family DNA binding protein
VTHEILTLDEACALLRLSPRTVRTLVHAGRLPGAKRVGQQWRFSKAEILAAFAPEGTPEGRNGRKTAGHRT